MQRLLLVEDDEKLGAQVVEQLRALGFEVDWLRDGTAALRADPADYALLLLDQMLPGAHGLDVLKRVRESSDVPVMMLTAVTDTASTVRALELGADDYVTKPFWPEELAARVQARLRRPVAERAGRVEVGALLVDLEAREVRVEGADLELTRLEFDLLALLVRRRGSALQRAWIADQVLEPERESSDRTLDVHVSRLRKKLGAYGACVQTVWGVGYRFDPDRMDPDRMDAGPKN